MNEVDKNDYDAFISYRRETSSDLASLLKIQLESHFNKKIFLDVNELQVGRFDEKLLHLIEKTPNFIIILSKGSLDRCKEKNDWLKREIIHALDCNRNIIPVMTETFTNPTENDWKLLPVKMRKLLSYSGIIYNHIYQDTAIKNLSKYMKIDDSPELSTPLLKYPKILFKKYWYISVTICLLVFGVFFVKYDTKLFNNNKLSINKIPKITIQTIPEINWNPIDKYFITPIEGKVENIQNIKNCHIIIYARTNNWYIQPDINNYLTNINVHGTWFQQTHLGGEYLILLVDSTYEPLLQSVSIPDTINVISKLIIKK